MPANQIKEINKEKDQTWYGKHVIHQPLFINTLKVNLSYAGFYLVAAIRDSGRRYFIEDNTKWLDPYKHVTMSAGVEFEVKNIKSIWACKIDNLTDIDYELLEYQPMPPRSVQLGITIKL